jgi:hypothetical protein
MRRIAALLLTLPLMLSLGACRSGDDAAATNDSAQVDPLRSQADSIARDMARAIAATSTRTGSWTSTESTETSEWTARMQGEHVSVIEERVKIGNAGIAIRGFFFAHSGALEQISEQRKVIDSTTVRRTERVSETRIDFSGTTPTAQRTIDGKPSTVTAAEIEQFKRHAAELVNAARNSSPDTTKK